MANSGAKAKEELAAKRAGTQASQFAHQALDEVKKGSTLEAAAKAHQGSVIVTGWFGRDSESALAALGKDPQFASSMLNLDKGEAPDQPLSNDKAAAFAVIIDEKAGPAPAKPEAVAARRRQALSLAQSKKADVLYKAWLAGLKKDAKIKDQIGVLAGK
jgi:hypothetical protein